MSKYRVTNIKTGQTLEVWAGSDFQASLLGSRRLQVGEIYVEVEEL